MDRDRPRRTPDVENKPLIIDQTHLLWQKNVNFIGWQNSRNMSYGILLALVEV